MRFASWILSAATLLWSAVPLVVQADELRITKPAAETPHHPARGSSMQKVEATFGAPTNRVPAVGHPPITRWEYPGFVVYFEGNLVLHTVTTLG